MSTADPKVPNTVITVPDPNKTPIASHSEIGGRAEWRSKSPDYPKFDIYFPDKNPFDGTTGYTNSGTTAEPLILQPKTGGHYEYKIKHHPVKGGKPVESGPFLFSVHPCGGCPNSG